MTTARLTPATPRRRQSWDAIAQLFEGRADPAWGHDRDLVDQSISDPWERGHKALVDTSVGLATNVAPLEEALAISAAAEVRCSFDHGRWAF